MVRSNVGDQIVDATKSLKRCENTVKIEKRLISTIKWCAFHLFTGQNTPQMIKSKKLLGDSHQDWYW